jgi:hypothetical protein
MENKHSEKIMIAVEDFNRAMRPTSDQEGLLSIISGSLDSACVLLAQISESLAILANNTRLIQDKEAVKESK